MDKTIKINLAGLVFQIEEDAYHILRDYLQEIDSRLKYTPGGSETLDDIEARIAEIFQSQRGISGIVNRENVEAMMEIIGKPEDFTQEEGGIPPTGSRPSGRRLYRNPDDKILVGVCSGISAYLNVDPVWIRLAFILFSLAYGIGFFAYIALWISLPLATTDAQKRELYGDNTRQKSSSRRRDYGKSAELTPAYKTGTERKSDASNVINEIFNALGKFFYALARIILIITGIAFVVAGFATLVSFIMAFYFRHPWFFFDQSFDTSFLNISDLLDFLINPALTPWVIALTSIVVILPLLAMIYWGIRMIVWFRAKDWILSLAAFVLWVISLSALAMISFNQGISFAESGRKIEQTTFEPEYDTLYLRIDKRIDGLRFDQEIHIPDNEYSLYLNKAEQELYGRPEMNLLYTEDNSSRIEIEKYSRGKSRSEAAEKAGSFIYNYRISGDNLYIDQFYTIPSGTKWSGSYVEIDLYIPEGTVIWVDKNAEILFDPYLGNGINSWELGNKFWIMTEDGLESCN